MTDEQNAETSSREDAKRPVERLVMAIPRERAARFVEQQLGWGTNASKNSPGAHYGAQELRELLDYIYGGEPKTTAEKISIEGKGWH
ncbi:MAG TPA: hypothetical protein ENI94_13055 [Gammaproteobacteria bacterium]|nr:hypothetical protein [Gammaproteobacteria bacterium]